MDKRSWWKGISVVLLLWGSMANTTTAQSTGITFSDQEVSTQDASMSPGCVAPPPVSSFLTTNNQVNLYFVATTTTADLLTDNWLAPDGSVGGGGQWPPVSGSYCYFDHLNISNLPPTQLGSWQARIYDNGSLLFSVPFMVSSLGPVAIPQIEYFFAILSNISYGASATLYWSVVGATSISIDQGIGAVSSSGAYVVTPGQTTTYTLTAQNSGGANNSTAAVTVTGQPPGGQQILTAMPNPALVTSGSLGMTTLSWSAPSSVQGVELHVDAPDGPLLAAGGQTGTAQTEQWVSDGMTFYLQDVTGGNPLTAAYTLDTVVVRVVPANATFFAASPLYIAPGQNSGTVMLTWNAPGVSSVQIWVLSASGSQMTGDLPSTGWTFSGNWVQQGMPFFLQNSTSGSGEGSSNTISTAQVSSDPPPSP
jgi:uncharacterized repeat protein (TIGR01451 family)